METDQDAIEQLSNQLRCLGTTDKEELIKQLKRLVGNHVTPTLANFLLEMNDWNLQAAVGSYFDINMPTPILSMTFVRNDAESNIFKTTPSSEILKMWYILNDGDEAWPSGCVLRFVGGDILTNTSMVSVPALSPNSSTVVTMRFYSPANPGIYKSEWRMITPKGSYFGDIIWVIMTVEGSEDVEIKTLKSESLSPKPSVSGYGQQSMYFESHP